MIGRRPACKGERRQVALPVPAEGGVVETGLVPVGAAGEVVVLAEEAERAVTGANGVALRHLEAVLGAVFAAVPRVAGETDSRNREHAGGHRRDDDILHRFSFPQRTEVVRQTLVVRSASSGDPQVE
jgi:hypothetical protein